MPANASAVEENVCTVYIILFLPGDIEIKKLYLSSSSYVASNLRLVLAVAVNVNRFTFVDSKLHSSPILDRIVRKVSLI